MWMFSTHPRNTILVDQASERPLICHDADSTEASRRSATSCNSSITSFFNCFIVNFSNFFVVLRLAYY